MPFPVFDPKDWEEIIEYREQYDKWMRENKGIFPGFPDDKRETALLSTALVTTSLALLKTQSDLEKLSALMAKSQLTVEKYTRSVYDYTRLVFLLTIVVAIAGILSFVPIDNIFVKLIFALVLLAFIGIITLVSTAKSHS